MKHITQTICIVLLLGCTQSPIVEQSKNSEVEVQYRSSERFEQFIQGFESADLQSPPPTGAIVCVGSSSMKMWRDTISEDLAPLTVIARGFGGSNMNDALFFADRIVLAYQPRAIVIYEGDNDIAQRISPALIRHTFIKFVAKVHDALPNCRIYFLSIKPSESRWKLWPKMQDANKLIAQTCVKDKRLTYIDVSSVLLNDKGLPREEYFKQDKLHLSRDGYLKWRDIVRPVLMKSELEHETK